MNLNIREYIKNFNRQVQGGGLKLKSNNNYDIQQKRLANVGEGVDNDDAVTKHQMEVGLSTKPNPTDVILVNGRNHMTGDLDLRGNKLILPGGIEMNRKLITNMDTDENDDLLAVNMITLKKYHPNAPEHTHEVLKDVALKELFNVTRSKQQSFEHLGGNYDNLVSYNDVKNIFLSRKESFPMGAALDMGNHTIFNVKTPTTADQGVNEGYVDVSLSTKADQTYVDAKTIANNVKVTKNTTVISDPTTKKLDTFDFGVDVIKLTQEYKDYVNKSHITSSSHLKDEFRYLMEDVDESSSMHDMAVSGIDDFSRSPHFFNKKAYDLQRHKDASNVYSERLGFNMYKLPEGEHTSCIEFFPVTMNNVSVDVVSTSLNITQQSTKQFSNYTRSIIPMHKLAKQDND